MRAVAEILGAKSSPFQIFSGVSAGAINSTALAIEAGDFIRGTDQLWDTWHSLTPDRVYRTDARSLASIGSRWMKELGVGGLFGAGTINHLLDTSPLRSLLTKKFVLSTLADHLKSGVITGVSVSATNYHTGTAVTFYDAPSAQPWVRSMRLGLRATLTVDHLMASAAIPIFFPPVFIDGAFFGDGCIRLASPLSPAIHLGADKILAVGVRALRTGDQTADLNQMNHAHSPALSEIGGVLLNAVFLDSLEGDVERLERINRTLSLMTPEQCQAATQTLRPIPILVLRPSRDLGSLAERQHEHFPLLLRYLLRGLGVAGARSGDLLSYLAFEPNYVRKLLDLGYEDTLARRDDVVTFFED